jgi:hypothetical protein
MDLQDSADVNNPFQKQVYTRLEERRKETP